MRHFLRHLRQFLRDLVHLPAACLELLILLREQNSLLRELIQFHTRRPAQTPYVQASARRLIPPQPITPRTDKDVFAVSRNQLRKLMGVQETRVVAPWRTDEQLPPPESQIDHSDQPFHPSQLQPNQPNHTLQPLPSGSATTATPTGE